MRLITFAVCYGVFSEFNTSKMLEVMTWNDCSAAKITLAHLLRNVTLWSVLQGTHNDTARSHVLTARFLLLNIR